MCLKDFEDFKFSRTEDNNNYLKWSASFILSTVLFPFGMKS